jgi:hypothetical protein
VISAETSQFFTLLVLDLVISSGLLARSLGGSWWFFGNPFSSVFQPSIAGFSGLWWFFGDCQWFLAASTIFGRH